MDTVLLTDGQQRKTLAAVRSLGKRKINIIVADETRFNPSAFSKYCNRSLVYPSPHKKPREFLDWLKMTIKKYKCNILFPMDDNTMNIVMKNFSEISILCKVLVPPLGSYNIANDKGKTQMLAVNSGVKCPWTIEVKDIKNIHKLANKIDYPVVIKPRQSSGSRGIRVVNSNSEFIEEYLKIHETQRFPIIQEYVGNGYRYDVCLLFDKKSNLKASFVQKELRHFPIKMGPSTVQESVYYDELIEEALKIMKKLNWCGVVELEFIMDEKDNVPKLLEINPRFWGSLQMAIFAGVDFPWLLYKIILDEHIEEVFKYKTELKCRWLLPGDIFHFLTNKNRFKISPPFFSRKKHNVKDDTIWKEDPMPVLGFLLACLKYAFNINMWKFIFKR